MTAFEQFKLKQFADNWNRVRRYVAALGLEDNPMDPTSPGRCCEPLGQQQHAPNCWRRKILAFMDDRSEGLPGVVTK